MDRHDGSQCLHLAWTRRTADTRASADNDDLRKDPACSATAGCQVLSAEPPEAAESIGTANRVAGNLGRTSGLLIPDGPTADTMRGALLRRPAGPKPGVSVLLACLPSYP